MAAWHRVVQNSSRMGGCLRCLHTHKFKCVSGMHTFKQGLGCPASCTFSDLFRSWLQLLPDPEPRKGCPLCQRAFRCSALLSSCRYYRPQPEAEAASPEDGEDAETEPEEGASGQQEGEQQLTKQQQVQRVASTRSTGDQGAPLSPDSQKSSLRLQVGN